MRYFIGIDLGGTNIAVGVVDEAGKILGRANASTPAFFPDTEIAAKMSKTAREALADANLTLDDIAWVGVGTPGTVNPVTGVVGKAANLGFENTPLASLVSEGLDNKPVYLENDANAAAYGERTAGAAKGLDSAIMMTLGTGVGGGIIVGGKIYSGFNYKGAELGHIGMWYGGVPCTCGRIGCIESYCSVTALKRMTIESMQLHPTSKMWAQAANSLDKVSGRTSFDAMRQGDPAAIAVVNQYIDYLAYAVSGMINLFQPQAIVIGGGISKEGDVLLAPVRERAYAITFDHDPCNCTKIIAATLGNDAGIIGAAFLGDLYGT